MLQIPSIVRSMQSYHPNESGVCVRLLSPLGCYPERLAFARPDSAIVVADDLVALVTKFSPIPCPEDFFTEVEFLSAFEVRVLASLLISREPESGGIKLYPVASEYKDCNYSLDLSNETVLQHLLDSLRHRLSKDSVRTMIHCPPCGGGRPYEFNQYANMRRERHDEISRSIDVSDHLVIRGLGALIKAGMLACHQEYLEQACMCLWIALEASLALTQRKLRAQGNPNPSPKDAGNLIDSVFAANRKSEGYFQDFYYTRVSAMHPESSFGTYPAAPLCADEYFLLNESLLAVYDFLLTDHVASEWKDR